MEQSSASPAWFRSTSQPEGCSRRTRRVGIDTSRASRLLTIFSSRSEETDWTVRKSEGHSMCCLDRHVCVADTYWYLTACPELMGLAVERLEGRWRAQK